MWCGVGQLLQIHFTLWCIDNSRTLMYHDLLVTLLNWCKRQTSNHYSYISTKFSLTYHIECSSGYRRRQQSRQYPLLWPTCVWLCLSVCLYVCLYFRNIKPKRLKIKSPNLAQGYIITIPRPPINIRSTSQTSRSQGHKVHNVAARQPCGTVSLRLCSRTTSRCRLVARRHNRAGLAYSSRSSGRRQLCALSSAQSLVLLLF